ncbi:MAG: diacylglycerol kinase family protein [Pseudomonadota bacterium]
MTKAPVFIVNPKSHKVKERGSVLESIAKDDDSIAVIHFDGQAPLSDTLSPYLEQGVDTIYLEGGDGTVVAILTACFLDQSRSQSLPRFAILPGGSTNLAHQVFGLKKFDAATIKHEIDQSKNPAFNSDMTKHRALLVQTSDRQTPFVGFLLSTGSLARLMLYTQDNLHGKRRGAISIARAILKLIVSPRSTQHSDGLALIRPSLFTRIFDDGGELSSEQTFSMFSTFRELSLGLSPFWGRGEHPIGFTHAAWPIRQLRLGIAKALLGGAPQSLEKHGLTSEGCSEMIFRSEGPVILDGEELPMSEDNIFKVSVSPDLDFIR